MMQIDLETGCVRLPKPSIELGPDSSLDGLVSSGVVVAPQAVGEICRESGIKIVERSNLAKSEHIQEMRGMQFRLTIVLRQDSLISIAMQNADDFNDSLRLELWDTEFRRHKSHRKWLEEWLGPPREIKGVNSIWSFGWGEIYTHYDEVTWGGTIFLAYKIEEPIKKNSPGSS